MTNIRRYHVPNAPVFMTVVCHNRVPYLAGDMARELLLSVMREVKSEMPFSMLGYVVLDDHFHWMIRLREDLQQGVSGSAPHTLTYEMGRDERGDDDGGTDGGAGRIAIEEGCLQNRDAGKRAGGIHPKHTISDVMQSVKLRFTHRYKKDQGIASNMAVWQRRFWDHIIRDEDDFNHHLDYIHYNPVKHGYVSNPADFQWSSLRTYVERGRYSKGWGCSEEPESLSGMAWE